MPKPFDANVTISFGYKRFLERCIKSLYKQTLEESKYEVIVVDNGSTDGTKAICDKFAQYSNFTYIYEPILGLSSARNCGWKHASGKYVGYLDDDAWADETWFEKALWSFSHTQPKPDWVGGPIELEWEVVSPEWITKEHWVTLGYVDWGNNPRFLSGPAERLGGGNSFFPLELLEEMQGFDTRLGRKKNLLLSGEETQLQHRLQARGGRLYYHPDIRIFHFVAKERTEPSFFYRRYYWGGVTDYIMSRTLEGVSFEHIAQSSQSGSKIVRVLANSIDSLGLSRAEGKTFQGRIYMSYVLGQLAAMLKYGWRTQ